MKNLIVKSVFYTFLATSFVSCVNDDDYNVPALGCTETTLVKTKRSITNSSIGNNCSIHC